MGKADLHLHTTHSDGAVPVRALLDAVAASGKLTVIAITDHDTIAGAEQARQLVSQGRYPFEVIIGEEVSTRDGHIIGLFLREAIIPGLSAAATIAAIHAQGGLAFAPHPFFNDRPLRHRRTMDGVGQIITTLALDAVEVDNSTPFLERANRQARQYATHHNLPALGASDAHILAAVGKSYTTFPGQSAADLRRAIGEGSVAPGAQHYAIPELLEYLSFWLGYGRHAGVRKGRHGTALQPREGQTTAY